MIDDSQDKDEFKDLYDNFVARLRDGADDMYYDLDELIDIFDFANESYDSYVCNAVLRLGARLYPDSDDLRVRQGVALIQHIDTDRAGFERFMQDNRERQSLMWDILRLYLYVDETRERKVELLDRIASIYRFEEDEEVVQFVNAAEYIGCARWLMSNIDRLRKLCQYEPTLLFDVAEIARAQRDNGLSIRLLEELTMAEPFSIDFWISLARSYDADKRIEEGTTAIDYARTLDPGNIQAKIYAYERADEFGLEPTDRLIGRLEELYAANPDNTVIMNLLAGKYGEAGRVDDQRRMYRKIYECVPDEPFALLEMLRADPDNAETYLKAFRDRVEDTGDAEDFDNNIRIIARVIGEYAHTDADKAGVLYGAFLKFKLYGDASREYLINMYLAGNDYKAIRTIESLSEVCGPIELPFEMFPIMSAMYLRAGGAEATLMVIEHFNKLLDENIPVSYDNYIAMTGTRTLLDRIKAMALGNNDITDDPVGLKGLVDRHGA